MPSRSLGIRGLFGIVIGKRPVKPFNAPLCSLTRSQFANQVAVTHAHVNDALMRAASRTQQVVHHGKLEQFADIGLIFNGRHFGDGLLQRLG